MMKTLLLFSLLFAAALALARRHAAPAANARSPGKHDTNAPINIAADNFQADLNAKTGTYTGNVIVIQGDIKHARRHGARRHRQRQGRQDLPPTAMWWWIRPPPAPPPATMASIRGAAHRVHDRPCRADKKGKDVMRGTQLTVNLVTGQAALGGGGARTPGSCGRPRAGHIHAQFTNAIGPGNEFSWFLKHKQA